MFLDRFTGYKIQATRPITCPLCVSFLSVIGFVRVPLYSKISWCRLSECCPKTQTLLAVFVFPFPFCSGRRSSRRLPFRWLLVLLPPRLIRFRKNEGYSHA